MLPKRFRWLFVLSILACLIPLGIISGRSPSLQTGLTVSIDSPTFSSYAASGFFTVTLNIPAPGDTVITFTVTDGTAISEADYHMTSTSPIIIPNGQTTGLISFDILTPSSEVTGSSDFTVRVFNPVSGIGVTGTATLTDTPTDLTASVVSVSEINLTWVNNNPNLDENQIERSPDGLTNWQVIDHIASTDNQYLSSGLVCDTTYHYRVRGFITLGSVFTNYSNIAMAKTYACSEPGAAPQPNYFTTNSVTLTWNHVTNATTYNIQIADNKTFTGAAPPITGIHGLSYTASGLDNGVYYWRVQAVAGSVAGTWSAVQVFVVHLPGI